MNQRDKDKNRDRIICFCYSVPKSVIIQAIEGGCSSLMDIRRETSASTGCAGCSEDVKKILRKYWKSPANKEPEGNQND